MLRQKLKVVEEAHGPRHQEFDTSKFTSAQDLVWIEPGNMAGQACGQWAPQRDFPLNVRLSEGQALPQTSFSRDPQVRPLNGLQSPRLAPPRRLAHLREEEVLMIVKNSPMRRFRIQGGRQSEFVQHRDIAASLWKKAGWPQ